MIQEYFIVLLLVVFGGLLAFNESDNRFIESGVWSVIVAVVSSVTMGTSFLPIFGVLYGYLLAVLAYDTRTSPDNSPELLKVAIGGALLVVFVLLGVGLNLYYRLVGYPELDSTAPEQVGGKK